MSVVDQSLYSLPAAYLINMIPHVYSQYLYSTQVKLWDNRNSRTALAKLDPATSKIPKHIIARIQRARAAHANGFETIGTYAIGLLAAHMMRVPVETLNSAAWGFTISRLIYIALYLGSVNDAIAAVRTLTWGYGWVLSLRLMWAAAQAAAGK